MMGVPAVYHPTVCVAIEGAAAKRTYDQLRMNVCMARGQVMAGFLRRQISRAVK